MSTQKIFFSYSRADSAFALKLAKDLRDAGAAIWIDQLDIPAGNHWDSAVEKALNTAAYVLVILSPSSTASTNVMDEVSFALESGKKIIPVLLEDCLAPFRLRRLQRIDFTTDYTSGFNQLVLSLSLAIPDGPKSEEVSGMSEVLVHHTPVGISQKDPAESQERENLLWEEACRLNTIAAYKYYLNESLLGEFKTEARLLIKQLEVEQKEDELEALLWQQAKTENSRNLYQHYLQEYPQGNYKTLALAAIADMDRAEKEEQDRLKEIEKQQEKERALKAKQEKERQEQIEREKARLEKEEKERIRQEERAKAQLEKEAREKEKQIEREKALKEKAERDKQKQIEREEAQRQKAERDKERQIEKEKAQKEKAERERLRKEEKLKALAEKGLTPEEAAEQESAGKKRLVMIGAGVLVLLLGIWGLTKIGGGGGGSASEDQDAWSETIARNDSASYAAYLAGFPSGQFFSIARQKLDSLNVVSQKKRDSLTSVAEAQAAAALAAAAQAREDSIRNAQAAAQTTPKETTTSQPARKPATTTQPATKPKTSTSSSTSSSSSSSSSASKPAPKYALGQHHFGGVVIFVNATGEHGFVAALKEEGKYSWTAAQRRCGAYRNDGFTDWRLPTRDELGIMYDNRKHLGSYTKGIYWSATEDGKDIAWGVNFINGSPGKYDKGSANSVWAVHPF